MTEKHYLSFEIYPHFCSELWCIVNSAVKKLVFWQIYQEGSACQ